MAEGGGRRKRPMTLSIQHSLSISTNSTRLLPYLVLGGQESVSDRSTLDLMGVTHVLNASCDIKCWFADSLTYLQIPISDEPDENAAQHFAAAHAYLDDVRRRRLAGEKVVCLVHCKTGMSRSSTMVLCHMLQAEGMLGLMATQRNTVHMLSDEAQNAELAHRRDPNVTLRDALAFIRERRPRASPNAGFMAQLLELEGKLHGGAVTINLDEYKKDRFGDVRLFAMGTVDPIVCYTGNGQNNAAALASAVEDAAKSEGSTDTSPAPSPPPTEPPPAAPSAPEPILAAVPAATITASLALPVVTTVDERGVAVSLGGLKAPPRTTKGRAPRDFGFPDMADEAPVDGPAVPAPTTVRGSRGAAAQRRNFGFDGDDDMACTPESGGGTGDTAMLISPQPGTSHVRVSSDVSMPDVTAATDGMGGDSTTAPSGTDDAMSPAASVDGGNNGTGVAFAPLHGRRRSASTTGGQSEVLPDLVPPRASRRISGAGVAAMSLEGSSIDLAASGTSLPRSRRASGEGSSTPQRRSSREDAEMSMSQQSNGASVSVVTDMAGDSLDALVSSTRSPPLSSVGRPGTGARKSVDEVPDTRARGASGGSSAMASSFTNSVPGATPMSVMGGALRPNSRLSLEVAGPTASSSEGPMSRSPVGMPLSGSFAAAAQRSATELRPASSIRTGSGMASGIMGLTIASSAPSAATAVPGSSSGAAASPLPSVASMRGMEVTSASSPQVVGGGFKPSSMGGLAVAGTSLRPGSAATSAAPVARESSTLSRMGKQLSSGVEAAAVASGVPSMLSVAGAAPTSATAGGVRASPRNPAAARVASPTLTHPTPGSTSLFVGGTSYTPSQKPQ